jgi:hypothetical protein
MKRILISESKMPKNRFLRHREAAGRGDPWIAALRSQ